MDRQDIDALLIGALYGELTPADEARLAAHLESHPTDRGALDDLKSARTKLRESRFFDVQLEPPQHISALLLQEAHRRAPKRAVATEGEQRESWFWRFAKSFMLHPAMAAAAMLVVVLGVAGTLYMKKGEHFADRSVAPSATGQKQLNEGTVAMTPEPEPERAGAGSAAAAADEGGYRAQLAEEQDLKKAEVGKDQAASEAKVAKDNNAEQRWRSEDANAKAPHGGVAKNKGIAVTTEQPQPKDLPAKETDRRVATGATKGAAVGKMDLDGTEDTGLTGDDYQGAYGRGAGAGGGGAATGTTTGAIGGAPGTANTVTTTPPRAAANGPYAQPPPPPAAAPGPAPATVASNDKATAAKPASPTPTQKPPAAAPSKIAAKAEPTPDAKPTAPTSTTSKSDTSKKVATQKPAEKAPAPAPTAPAQDSTLIAWAKGQHVKSVALAKNGDCTGAAKLALTVSNRAPEYYAQNMATDRALKGCKSYIDAERDKEAEKAAKTRAQKRVNADESQQIK